MRLECGLMNLEDVSAQVRIFFALWPTAAEQALLSGWQSPLHLNTGGRIMQPEYLHTTLVFIGSISAARLEALQLAAQEVSARPFVLCLDQAHYWGHNHIVYAAPGQVPEQLSQLVETLERRLLAHRFQFDPREYKPHVTLLRSARWSDQPLPTMRPVRWKIADFALVQSLSEHGTAAYRVLAHFPLRPSQA